MTNPTKHLPARSSRALALALLASTVACRTATSAGAAGPATPAPTAARAAPTARSTAAPAKPVKTAAVSSASTADEAAPPSTTVEILPRVLVTPSGNAYLVLRAGPVEQDGVGAWDVLYLAGDDTASLAPAGEDRRNAAARELVEAFAPMADVGALGRMSVTAVFGRPGATGAAERLWFTRDATGWGALGAATERGFAQVPPFNTELGRDPDEEASARRSAEAFISEADHADYDAAWARTSALTKAMMSRPEFERHLQELPGRDRDRDQDLYLSFVPQADRFLPGASVVVWVARATNLGPSVETLVLRLDDDMEWRIASVIEWTGKRAPSAVAAQATGPALETEDAP